MKLLAGVTRLFRPCLSTRVPQVSFFALRCLSTSAKCLDTSDSSRPPKESDTSQAIHVEKPRRAKNADWTTEERLKLRDAYAMGMTAKAIAALLPTRTFSAIEFQMVDLSHKASTDMSQKDPRQSDGHWPMTNCFENSMPMESHIMSFARTFLPGRNNLYI